MRNRFFAIGALILVTPLCSAQKQSASKRNEQDRSVLSPQELFRRLSPSIVAVETGDSDDSVKLIGSGVVLAPDLIVTNRHVLERGSKVRIVQGQQMCRVLVAWVDPDHDLALLHVSRGYDPACRLSAPSVSLRASSTAVGERVYTIGTPEGLELSLSEGIISGLREFENGHVIQTSAAISHGSSGGGLFDAQGRLIGITTFFLAEGESLNFALPAEWVQSLLEVGRSSRPDDKSSPSVFDDATSLKYNLTQLEGGGLLPTVTSVEESSATWAITDSILACIMDQVQNEPASNDPYCSHNWPVWKTASINMLAFRGTVQALESAADRQAHNPSGSEFDNPEAARNMAKYVSSIWVKLREVYCQNRPNGIFTDLQGEIRTCLPDVGTPVGYVGSRH